MFYLPTVFIVFFCVGGREAPELFDTIKHFTELKLLLQFNDH